MNKKFMTFALASLVGASSMWAVQPVKKTAKTAKKVVAPVEKVTLKSASDSLSYAAGMAMTDGLMQYLKGSLGVDSTNMKDFKRGLQESLANGNKKEYQAYLAGLQVASMLETRMIPGAKNDFKDTKDTINVNMLQKGFIAAIEGNHTLFSQANAEQFFKTRRETEQHAKMERLYGDNRRAGEKFLAENKTKEGVQTLPDGLQYKVLVKGEGETPKSTDKVTVRYEGKLVDGKVFDSSYKRTPNTTTFPVNGVIKGWTEALTMMPVGSTWELYIPYQLAYGDREMGGEIKPFSALIFKVELVCIGDPKPEAEKATPANTANKDKKNVKEQKKTKKGKK